MQCDLFSVYDAVISHACSIARLNGEILAFQLNVHCTTLFKCSERNAMK